MSRTGRPPKTTPTIRWDTYLSVDVASQVELLLLDPMREKVRHGARSALIEQLLREWLEKKKAEIRGEKALRALGTGGDFMG